MFYQELVNNIGLPNIQQLSRTAFNDVIILDQYVACAHVFPMREHVSDIEKVYCGNWQKTACGLLDQSLEKHVVAIGGLDLHISKTQQYISDLQSRQFIKRSYYQLLIEKYFLPQPISIHDEFYASKLDKIVFCSFHYSNKTHASQSLSHYCGKWSLTDTISIHDLAWQVFYYINNLLTKLDDHVMKVKTIHHCLQTIVEIQNS